MDGATDAAALAALLDRHYDAQVAHRCQPKLLSIGVLTLPVLIRSPDQRAYHRAAHWAQAPVGASSSCGSSACVCVRYVVSSRETALLNETARAALAAENRTYADLVEVPAVPHGPLRSALRDSAAGPLGANCVLKILSWLQHALRAAPRTPFVAYGDDDTFWALTRVTQSLGVLHAAGAASLRLYAGAMQYHSFWDFQRMIAYGWHWTFPMAARGFATDYAAPRAMPFGADAPARDFARRFHRPFPMAHGHGVILSAPLAAALPGARAVVEFLRLYDSWLDSRAGRRDARRAASSPKCRLGGDATLGAWIAALNESLVAVDLLNFNMNWPWPLYNRSFGADARAQLHNLHAFHLFGAAAANPKLWMALHRTTTIPHEAAQPATDGGLPRLRCRHGVDAVLARALLDRWVAANASQPRPRRVGRWLTRQVREPPASRLVHPEWLFCGLTCFDQKRSRCQREWADL
jgi:hypothetical protein